MGNGSYPGDDGAGSSSNGGRDDAVVGRALVSLGSASGNVESHLGRSVAYVRARPVTRADGSQGP
jgi:hypothetical protein